MYTFLMFYFAFRGAGSFLIGSCREFLQEGIPSGGWVWDIALGGISGIYRPWLYFRLPGVFAAA